MKPTEVLLSRISPVYRKSDFKCWKGAGVCCKKGFTALFLSLHHPDTPPSEPSADLSFISEVNQTCARAAFAESVKQQMIKHALPTDTLQF